MQVNLISNYNDLGLGLARGDQLFDVENVVGANYADMVAGNDLANAFFGLNGDDNLVGGGANDALYGGAENDRLEGDAGGDLLDGGAGVDTVNYLWSPGPLPSNPAAGIGSGC